MHEHHEQEMTPSALSYQLRDTIVSPPASLMCHRVHPGSHAVLSNCLHPQYEAVQVHLKQP